MAKMFDPMKGLPPFPFLVRGNSGAIWRVTGFTNDPSLKMEVPKDETSKLPTLKQCDAVCVLEGIGAEYGDKTTLYASSLINNYGAMLVNGGTLWSSQFGDAFGEGNIDPVSVKTTDGIKPDAISHKQ